MIFGKKEKELKDLLEIYKEQNRKLKSDIANLEELYQHKKQNNQEMKDITNEDMKDKFRVIVGITKKHIEPIVFVNGIKIQEAVKIEFKYQIGELPWINVEF